MKLAFLRAALAAAALASTAGAHGAEIVLEQSAVQKLVVESLFRDNGRCVRQRGACSARLDKPTVTLSTGRVVIRAHLGARVGMDFGDRDQTSAWAFLDFSEPFRSHRSRRRRRSRRLRDIFI